MWLRALGAPEVGHPRPPRSRLPQPCSRPGEAQAKGLPAAPTLRAGAGEEGGCTVELRRDQSVSAQTSPRPRAPGKRAPVLEPQTEEKPEAPPGIPAARSMELRGYRHKSPPPPALGPHAPHAAPAPFLLPIPHRWQNSHLCSFPGPRGSQTGAPWPRAPEEKGRGVTRLRGRVGGGPRGGGDGVVRELGAPAVARV